MPQFHFAPFIQNGKNRECQGKNENERETNSKTKQRSKRKEKLLYKKKGSSRHNTQGADEKKRNFQVVVVDYEGNSDGFRKSVTTFGKSQENFQPKLSTICFRTVIVDLFAW